MLFWTVEQREVGLRAIETIYAVRTVGAASARPLPVGKPLALDFDMAEHMDRQCNAGLLVLHKGQVRFEGYARGYRPDGRWASFSVAKSIVSTLVGIAVYDGAIGGTDDRITTYLPGLAGSAYDDVTVHQLLTMTSGVAWDEAYDDPAADVARFWGQTPEPGIDQFSAYMRGLTKAGPAGSRWLYNTGETNLLGTLLATATGQSLSDYLSAKLWRPLGMAQDACWIIGSGGTEVGGCCLSATLGDFARFGQFVVDGGCIDGVRVLPDGWIETATTRQADIEEVGCGYGYQWWTNDDGSFDARGIFGQGIFIDRGARLVIASSGNWPHAIEPDTLGPERQHFYRRIRALVTA